MRLYSIGHSTRTLDELVATLRSFGIRTLVDIRGLVVYWRALVRSVVLFPVQVADTQRHRARHTIAHDSVIEPDDWDNPAGR